MAINIHKILSDAFLEMCKTGKIESITIKDLLKKTGVSRQAFYNRFRDKNDLIQWTYEHNVLRCFLENGLKESYYENTLTYYKAIDEYRYFMKQACALTGQNCLKDFMYQFALNYDLEYHKHFNHGQPLSEDFQFATWYHAAASIDVAMRWIAEKNPESPETMARRITIMRKISLSDSYFGENNKIYMVPK